MDRDPGRNDRRLEWRERAIPWNHRMDTAHLRHIFRHMNMVAAVAAYVSIRFDVRNSRQVDTMIYHIVKDDRIRSDITQTAIRRGVAAAKHIDDPEMAPDFRNPVITIKAGQWGLNPVAEGFVAHMEVGSRSHPQHVQFGVPKRVGEELSKYDVGEISITPAKCTISFTNYVPKVRELDPPRRKASIPELTSTISYLQSEPEPLLAADMNGWGAMVSDGHTTARFDLSERVDAVEIARKSEKPIDKWNVMKDDMRYERRHGHKKTNDNVEAKREEKKKKCGGDRRHAKLGHELCNLKKKRGAELKDLRRTHAAELRTIRKSHTGTESDLKRLIEPVKMRHGLERAAVKERYARREREMRAERARCVLSNSYKKHVDNQERQERVSKAERSLEHAMHASACMIVAWAIANDAAIVLEDLRGMSKGWTKFNKRTRSRLYISAMMKFQDLIYEKARWHGVEVLYMHPRNTSALCCACGNRLVGSYTYRNCAHCHIRVDRDVNAVLNMLRTAAAARYGRRVRPTLDEARSKPDVILGPGEVVREGGALRVYGEVAGEAAA